MSDLLNERVTEGEAFNPHDFTIYLATLLTYSRLYVTAFSAAAYKLLSQTFGTMHTVRFYEFSY